MKRQVCVMIEENLFEIEGKEDYQKGLLYFKGNMETPVDIRKAFECFNKAARVGHLEAKYYVGFLYLYGSPYVLKNEMMGMNIMKELADDGFEMAQFCYGYGLFYGLGVEIDTTFGIEYLKKSARQGNIMAANLLAEVYLTGNGVQKNKILAQQYNEQARLSGIEEAEFRKIRIMVMGQ